MAERRVTVPAGGEAVSSRELTTMSVPPESPFVPQAPAASARAMERAKIGTRVGFMLGSPYLCRSVQYSPKPRLFQIRGDGLRVA
jgi:hypothetical protein